MMHKPRLFYLSTSLNIGGTEKFLVTLVEGLSNEFDITVGYLKEKGILGARLEKNGVPVHRVASFRRLAAFLKERRFDGMHTFLYRANVLGRFAGALAGVPVIVSTQQSIDAWKKKRHVWLDSLSARCCDCIIANSQTVRSLLIAREKIIPEKIRVVNNGLESRAFSGAEEKQSVRKELGIAPGVPVVVCVTRLHREKGVDFLPEIAERTEAAFFLIAGDGPERAALEAGIRARGLENRFLFTGWREDIARLLRASDVFLLPSREESFPQAVLEAMGAGLPVVASDVGGVCEAVEHGVTGMLVAPGDCDGFAEALKELVAPSPRAGDMGAAGRRASERFSESGMIEAVRNIYRELLFRKTQGRKEY